jgi:hypothetical protein
MLTRCGWPIDGLHQIRFRHLRPAFDLEPLRDIQEMRFARLGIDTSGSLGLALEGGAATLCILAVARTLLVLRLPVIPDLLEGVFERTERDAMRRLAVPVGVLGRLQRVDVRLLRLLGRTRQCGGQPLLSFLLSTIVLLTPRSNGRPRQ